MHRFARIQSRLLTNAQKLILSCALLKNAVAKPPMLVPSCALLKNVVAKAPKLLPSCTLLKNAVAKAPMLCAAEKMQLPKPQCWYCPVRC